jgi:hypothetical protein
MELIEDLDPEQARSWFDAATRAVEIARRLDSVRARAQSGALMGGCLWATGRLREAFEWLERAWEEADRSNDSCANEAAQNARFNLTNLCDYHEALRWSLRETSRLRNRESGYNERFNFLDQVGDHARLGQLDEVRRLMREAPSEELTASGRAFLSFWRATLMMRSDAGTPTSAACA